MSGVSRHVVLTTIALSAGCAGRPPVSTSARPMADVRRAIDSMVSDPRFRSAQLGILIVDPARRDTLYSRNAGKLFIPASNQKLVTGAVALAVLGPDFRFSTTVSARGSVAGGVLDGDLLVAGTGDPSVSDHMRGDAMSVLHAMAESVAVHGVTRVRGRLVSSLDAFPDATLGFGWAWDDLDFPYSAGVDELFFNEGFTRVIVHGGERDGDPAAVSTKPASTYPAVRVLAVTESGHASTLELLQDSSDVTAGRVIVRGTIPPGTTDTLEIAFRNQVGAYLAGFDEALRARGIVVEGGVASQTTPVRATGAPSMEPPFTPLFSIVSPPLRDILAAFEKPSQNQIGEILFKTLGRSRTGSGTADSARVVVRSQVLAWGAAPDGFVVHDGSGLSRHDVITPETLAKVLDAATRLPGFDALYDALPVAGIDGTIATRMRNTPAQGNVRGKTGTLDMVRSLSGYVTTADGHRLIAVQLANNWTVPVREVEQMQDAILVLLASMRLGSQR